MRGTSDGKLEEAFRSAIGVLTGNGTSSGVISMLSDYNGPLAKNAYSDYSFAVRLNFQLSQKAYNATYVWEGDHPDAAVPTDSTKYHKGDTVTADTTQYVAGKTSLAGTKDGVEGTWTFNKWTPGEYANITGNVQFVGTWYASTAAYAAAPTDATVKAGIDAGTTTKITADNFKTYFTSDSNIATGAVTPLTTTKGTTYFFCMGT